MHFRVHDLPFQPKHQEHFPVVGGFPGYTVETLRLCELQLSADILPGV